MLFYLLVLSILLAALCVIRAVLYHLLYKRFPGPFAWPLAGNLPQLVLAGSVDNFLLRTQSLASVTEVWLPQLVILVNSVPTCHEVLVLKSANFVQRPAKDDALKLLGFYHRGVIFNNDIDLWKTSRSMIVRALQSQLIEPTIGVLGERYALLRPGIETIASSSSNGGVVDIGKVAERIIVDTLGIVILGIDFEYCLGGEPEFVKLSQQFAELVMICTIWPSFVWKHNFIKKIGYLKQQNTRRIEVVEELVQQILSKHAQGSELPKGRPSFSQLVCAASTESNSKFSYQHLAQIVSDMVFAGTDTTYHAIAFACLALAEHEAVQEKLRSELSRFFSATSFPTLKDLSQLPYADAVFKESMLHMNVIPIVYRQNIAPDTIDGVAIPVRTMVMTRTHPTWNSAHFRNHKLLPFDPERHLNADTASGCFAFGGGLRQCPGMQLALLQMKLFFMLLLRDFTITQHNGLSQKTIRVENVLVLQAMEPVLVHIKKRGK